MNSLRVAKAQSSNKKEYAILEKENTNIRFSRNIVSQYLNEFVKDGEFGKINTRPVIFFSLPEKVPNSVIQS
ncbi:hypothetical protein EfmAA242_03080 [Enterococcus faecium]|nr:hypothetical protein EfmAA242_03080 [Enterococcus faecium]